VFQGVEHLIWEDPPEFQSEEEAHSALDALLNELGDPGTMPGDDPGNMPGAGADVAREDSSDAAKVPVAPAWNQSDNKLYGGHEGEGPSGITLEENHWPGAQVAQPQPRESETTKAVEEPASDTPSTIVPLVSAPVQNTMAKPPKIKDAGSSVGTQQPQTQIQTKTQTQTQTQTKTQTQTLAPEIEQHLDFGEETNRRWWVPVAMVLAAATLFTQVLWYQFDEWSMDPQTRPLYEVACGMLGCELPVMRDVASMVAKNLVVRSHPDVAGALVVNAVIVNEAEFAQPFPILELRFTALQGGLVAGRQFAPEEYLAGELLGERMVPRLVPVHVELEIEDPGEAAVNYYLTFR
jgi:hypothetical protein